MNTAREFREKKHAPHNGWQQQLIDYVYVTLGSLSLAVGIALFIVPFHFVPGGVIGLSVIVNQLTGFPVGMVSLAINIPLLLWGIRTLGGHVGLKTMYAMVFNSVLIDFFSEYLHVQPLTHDMLVASVFGGLLVGFGIALIIRGNATSGGTDIIAQILSRHLLVPVGKLFLIVDGLIVLTGVAVFQNLDGVPYAAIIIFVISRTIDYTISGFDNRKAVFIVSEYYVEIRQFILVELDRTGTLIPGRGLFFQDKERNIIFTALSRKELSRLQQFIARTDPNAFLTAINTNEVFGLGFRKIHK